MQLEVSRVVRDRVIDARFRLDLHVVVVDRQACRVERESGALLARLQEARVTRSLNRDRINDRKVELFVIDQIELDRVVIAPPGLLLARLVWTQAPEQSLQYLFRRPERRLGLAAGLAIRVQAQTRLLRLIGLQLVVLVGQDAIHEFAQLARLSRQRVFALLQLLCRCGLGLGLGLLRE